MSEIFKKMGPEQLLIGLQEVAAGDTRYTAKAQGLLGWYRQMGSFTFKQSAFAAKIIQQCKRQLAKKPKLKKYSLYAIDDGVNIKLGYSSKPKKRLGEMQVGHPTKLELVWELFVGEVEVLAQKAERQLHRFCRAHHKRGEWFHRDCMVLVRQFELKRQIDDQRKEEMAELAIVAAARERI
jgi:hypothetical protein